MLRYPSMNIKELFQEAQRAETPPQAIGIYEKIIQQDPQNSEAYNNIGELYGNMGQPGRALPYFVKATELNPMKGVYYSNLALVLHCQGHVEEAISNYSKSIALQPSWSAYNNRATLYNYRKEYDNAIADCTAALKLNGQNGEVCTKAHLYATRADAYMGKGDYKKALQDLNTGMALNPSDDIIGFYDKGILRCNLKLGISPCEGKGCK